MSRAELDLEQRVARWSRVITLARLDGEDLEALRLAVGRERDRRVWAEGADLERALADVAPEERGGRGRAAQ